MKQENASKAVAMVAIVIFMCVIYALVIEQVLDNEICKTSIVEERRNTGYDCLILFWGFPLFIFLTKQKV